MQAFIACYCAISLIPGQLFYDDKAIVFNLKDADEYTITPRNGSAAADDEESKSDDE